jgi:hypothetical protein
MPGLTDRLDAAPFADADGSFTQVEPLFASVWCELPDDPDRFSFGWRRVRAWRGCPAGRRPARHGDIALQN